MDKQLIGSLAAMLGDKTRIEGTTLHAVVAHEDMYLSARVRTEPVPEIYITTRRLDGFCMTVQWHNRWFEGMLGEPSFADRFDIDGNDLPLLQRWLDEASRVALVASIYTFETEDAFSGYTSSRQRSWSYELANDQLVVTKGARENDADAFMTAVRTGCAIAARSQRWAREYAELATKLGGSAAAEVEIGGAPVMSITRSSIDVTVRLVRTGVGDDRLRTVIDAPRVGLEGTLSLVGDAIPRGSRPPLPDGRKRKRDGDYTLRASSDAAANKLDELANKLIALAEPAVIVVDTDSVDVWFDGAPLDLARFDAAVALAAHLAVDAVAAQGPYR